MQYRWWCLAAVFFALGMLSLEGLSHGGGLDRHGGHTDRRSGEYHCHRASCIDNSTSPRQDTASAERKDPLWLPLYDRTKWPHWVDADRDCQDTRAEILIAASMGPVKFKRNRGCVVTWGQWRDPYTARVYTRAADLDIDHVVPLAWAHGHGAAAWSRPMRRAFANDMDNLLAVGAEENRAKGSQGPDTWLPANGEYRCDYLRRFLRVVARYNLAFEPLEMTALALMRKQCGID